MNVEVEMVGDVKSIYFVVGHKFKVATKRMLHVCSVRPYLMAIVVTIVICFYLLSE